MTVETLDMTPDPMETAALWCMRLSEGDMVEAEWDALEGWLASAPSHADELMAASQAWRIAGDIADWPQVIALRTRALEQYRRANQRHWATARAPVTGRSWRGAYAVAASVVLLVAAALGWHLTRPQEYHTGIGERQVAMLTDGSRASLDADTDIAVRMKDAVRQVEVTSGRVKFDVSKDALRPFTVAAGDKLIVAVGTSFSVELIDGQMRVILYEGQVEVRDRDDTIAAEQGGTASRHALNPGYQLVDRVGTGGPSRVTRADLAASLAWEQGMLSFEREPLASAIERMNRYAAKPIRLSDPALRDIPIDGLFRAGDVAAFTEGVVALHPVRGRISSREIVLSPR